MKAAYNFSNTLALYKQKKIEIYEDPNDPNYIYKKVKINLTFD